MELESKFHLVLGLGPQLLILERGRSCDIVAQTSHVTNLWGPLLMLSMGTSETLSISSTIHLIFTICLTDDLFLLTLALNLLKTKKMVVIWGLATLEQSIIQPLASLYPCCHISLCRSRLQLVSRGWCIRTPEQATLGGPAAYPTHVSSSCVCGIEKSRQATQSDQLASSYLVNLWTWSRRAEFTKSVKKVRTFLTIDPVPHIPRPDFLTTPCFLPRRTIDSQVTNTSCPEARGTRRHLWMIPISQYISPQDYRSFLDTFFTVMGSSSMLCE